MDAGFDPSSVVGAVGSVWGNALGAVIALAYFLDKFTQNRSGDNQRVKALTEDNARLENRMRDAEAGEKAAIDARDKAVTDRNDMIQELSDVKVQYATITERLDNLTKQSEGMAKQCEGLAHQCDQLAAQNQELVVQNKQLSDQVRQLLQQGTHQ